MAWPEKYANGYNSTNLPPIESWERFQVWMRPAGLPHFRKLWGKSSEGVLNGTYRVVINDVWDAKGFKGTKSIVFTENGPFGPKNIFLAMMFLTTGIFCLVVAISVHAVRIRKLGDLRMLSKNKEE